ncbi:MAG: glycoside hydrolase family 127 protein [Bacteroidales bacterium]|nr:glycoside hydrolase family 127 protein [Bacteroidales bacterium]
MPLFFFALANGQDQSSNPSLSFFANPRKEIAPKFENLPVNQIKPNGWIKAQMEQDLTSGFVGKLDKLVPRIFNDDIYKTAQRKSKTDIPNAGTQKLTGADWEISMQWWGGETQANWWDGFLRNAYLTGNKLAIIKSNTYIRKVLASQGSDGYLGIYGKEMRYKHESDNGELWAQATLFRLLLGYYELSGDKKALTAVERAMTLTMSKYNEKGISPFNVKTDYGGVTHGLMMTDACEVLYRITHKTKYRDFAVYLYKEFSKYPLAHAYNDARYEYLAKGDELFQSHSAHTYEHLRTLIFVTQSTGYSQMKTAYDNALHKLSYCLLPSGAGFGDEWLAGKKANADSTAAEFCGMLELRNFYASALQKSGEAEFGDKAETVTFNAMQGARYSDGKGITYCKTDNCTLLNRTSPHSGYHEEDPRYKYSPTHADAAVCCNPSYGRNLPYYVSNMWMKARDGFAAVLFGGSTLSTNYNGAKVTIQEKTAYPFSDEIEFSLTTSKPTEFTIYIRKPQWSKQVFAEAQGATISEREGYFLVQKKWKSGDKIRVNFQNEIQTVLSNDEVALRRGTLVFALPISSRNETVREYDVAGFKDFYVFPTDSSYKNARLVDSNKDNCFGFIFKNEGATNNPWYEGKTYLSGEIFNIKTNKNESIRLIPMGSTVLRKVTFKFKL